jgi:hypothetical protein
MPIAVVTENPRARGVVSRVAARVVGPAATVDSGGVAATVDVGDATDDAANGRADVVTDTVAAAALVVAALAFATAAGAGVVAAGCELGLGGPGAVTAGAHSDRG